MAIKKVTITDIKDYDKGKDGQLYKTKDGRNYIRRMIKAEGSENILSGFKSKANENWAIGEEVSINVEKVEKDGRTYYNFSDVKMEDRMMDMLLDAQRRLGKLEAKVFPMETPVMDSTNDGHDPEPIDDELAGDFIPFN